MRILIYVIVLCLILQLTSAFDILDILRQAVGINNQSQQQISKVSKTAKID